MLNQIVTNLIQSNPAGTFGKMVLIVAFSFLVFGCMRLAAATQESADRNKGRGVRGWNLDD
jgi:hypothetical protein